MPDSLRATAAYGHSAATSSLGEDRQGRAAALPLAWPVRLVVVIKGAWPFCFCVLSREDPMPATATRPDPASSRQQRVDACFIAG